MANTKALDLEAGSGQYLYHADHSSLSQTTAFTIEMYIKIETAQNHYVAAKGGSGADNTYSWDLLIKADNGIRFAFENSSDEGFFLDSASTLTTGAYAHIAVTYESGSLIIYINGVANNSSGATGSIRDTNTSLYIGAGVNGGQTFDGIIDDVRIWRYL